MNYKIIIGITLLLMPYAFKGFGQTFERGRKESRSFKLYDRTSLEINNKYGNVHLFNWDKDSVKIEIDLKVRANKESKVDKIFDYIDFEFSDSRYYIIAHTTFRQNLGGFWSELSDLANTVFSGNNKAQIDYNVYLPSNINVKLENKFGNIYCTNREGKFEVSLSNGDLRANKLNGETELNLSFGNVGINHIENGKLIGSYVDMDLSSAVELFVESKSSTYNFEKIGVLNLKSRRDKFYIDEITSISGETSFSYLSIKRFSNYLRLTTEYGEVKLKGVKPGFKMVELNSKYSDIIMQLSNMVNCNVDLNHTESTGLILPDTFKGKSKSIIDEKEGTANTKGYFGNKEEAEAEIKINIKSGSVSFMDEINLF